MNDNKTMDRAEIIAALRAECAECSEQHWCKGGINGVGLHCPIQDAAALLERDAEPPNDPLTLDELREMSNTDWVWVVFPELLPEENCWYRAKKLYDLYSHAHYGKTWLAYRRKPDGGGE